jgi:hypothetical protein
MTSSVLSAVVLTPGGSVVIVNFVVSFVSTDVTVVCEEELAVDIEVDEGIFAVELTDNVVGFVSNIVDGNVDDDVASVDCRDVALGAMLALLVDVGKLFIVAEVAVLSVDRRVEGWGSADVVCEVITVVDLIVVDCVFAFVGKAVVFLNVVSCVVGFTPVVTRDVLAVVDVRTVILVVDAPTLVVVKVCGAFVASEFVDDTLV